MESLIGKTIGKYKILEELGKGGMAVVYRGQDMDLGRNVAIKIMLPTHQESTKSLHRFTLEARKLAQMSHPNIVMVWDYGEYEGVPYLVMEYIPGGTLSAKMKRIFTVKEAIDLLIPIGNALHYAHQKARIVHRDIKPSNILFNDSGQPLVTDFGIAKLMDADESEGLTGTGVLIGTPSYMSPEQIQGKPLDARSDVYSLGVLFFELVTGHKPYTANTPIEISLKHLNDPVPRPRQFVRDISSNAELVIMKAMAKKPEDRFPDMAAFVSALEDLAAGKNTLNKQQKKTSLSDIPAHQTAKKKKLPVWLILSAVFLIMLVIVGANLLSNGQAISSHPAAEPIATINLPATESPTAEITQSPAITATFQSTNAVVEPGLDATPTTSIDLSNALRPSDIERITELTRREKISVIDLDWTRDGKWIVNAGSNALSLIDSTTMDIMDSISLNNSIPSKLFVSDDSSIIGVLFGNEIRLYSVEPVKLERTIPLTSRASSIAISKGNEFIAANMADNRVLLINPLDGTVLRNLRSNYGGWGVAFSPDGAWIASGTSQGALIWEVQTGVWHPISTGQDSLINAVVFSNDGKVLAGGAKGVIYLWDVETGSQIKKLEGSFDNINSLRFSPDDSLLLSATKDGFVQLWDVENGKLAIQYDSHKSEVFKAVFSPSGELIASGANEGVIRLWGIP